MTNRVTITDVRRAGHCVAGARLWFEGHGIDFRRFIAEGMTVDEVLEQCGHDAHAIAVVEHMRSREGDRDARET